MSLSEIGESTVYVYAPEDILVRKLRWFRLGGERSERHWRDVMGILRIAGERMDYDYLEQGPRTSTFTIFFIGPGRRRCDYRKAFHVLHM